MGKKNKREVTAPPRVSPLVKMFKEVREDNPAFENRVEWVAEWSEPKEEKYSGIDPRVDVRFLADVPDHLLTRVYIKPEYYNPTLNKGWHTQAQPVKGGYMVYLDYEFWDFCKEDELIRLREFGVRATDGTYLYDGDIIELSGAEKYVIRYSENQQGFRLYKDLEVEDWYIWSDLMLKYHENPLVTTIKKIGSIYG